MPVHTNPFTDAELSRRLERVRAEIAARELAGLILTSPENVFYFTGLDHWGYFAPHMLLLPAQGDPVLVTRAMEKVAVGNMVRSARFEGHSDSETAADQMARVVHRAGLAGKRLGLEFDTSGLSYGLGRSLTGQAEADWHDISGVVDKIRLVKSAEEIALMRRAAKAGDAGMLAAIAAIHDGAHERDVAAECQAAMTRAGGDPPGFGPFIRPQARMGEEHTTWGDGHYRSGEIVFLEVAGCHGRYNAPSGRMVHVGSVPDDDAEAAALAQRGFDAVIEALKPGVLAREVYGAWQKVVDDAGLEHYRRHHCGYAVGIGFPPSWTGGNRVTGLRHDSDMQVESGMTFHIMSWFTHTGRGNYFISNTVALGPEGAEVLTTAPHGPIVT